MNSKYFLHRKYPQSTKYQTRCTMGPSDSEEADVPACRVCECEQVEVRGQWCQCARCGEFRISEEAEVNLRHDGLPWTLRVSCWIRHAWLEGRQVLVRASDIEWIKSDWHGRSVSEKQDALLLALAKLSDRPGAAVAIVRDVDHVLAWCESPEEFDYHVDALRERSLVVSAGLDPEWTLTSMGWDRVAQLSATSHVSPDLVFVAMSFDPGLAGAWTQGLAPGIRDAGYRPVRVDTDEHVDKIDDRIMALIRQSRFVVVDVTTQNRGAYFEAGFALGLARPVIWSVREDDLRNVHFDTRQFNHIVWRDEEDLRRKVADRLLGVFGRGPVA